MADSINFVREQRRRLSKQQQLDLKIFRTASFVGGGAVVIMVLALGVQFFLRSQVQAAIDSQNVQLSIITAQAENEKSYVTFATKLQTLSELFTNRRNKQEAIAYFSTLFDDTVLINNISYRANENELSFGIQTQNVFSLDRVIKVLNTQDVKDKFQSLTYDELNRGIDGEYQIKVIVVLNTDTDL